MIDVWDEEDREDKFITSQGSISLFDAATRVGLVVVGGEQYSFHSSFFSCQPTRLPRIGESVQIIFTTGGLLLAVRA